MPIPEKITNAVDIIPLHSHEQAKRYLNKFSKATIIYYLINDADDTDYQTAEFPLFMSFSKKNPNGEQFGTVLMEDERIYYKPSGHYEFRMRQHTSIENLLQVTKIRNIVLKQHIIADYLNEMPVNFESTFLPIKGKQYPPCHPWIVEFPTDSDSTNGVPKATHHKQLEIIMEKFTELMFKNADYDFSIYLNRLNQIFGLAIFHSSIKTTFTSHIATTVSVPAPNHLTHYYWKTNAENYNALMSFITAPAREPTPSLKDLCFSAIYKEKNPATLFKHFPKDKPNPIPGDLIDDPRFSQKQTVQKHYSKSFW